MKFTERIANVFRRKRPTEREAIEALGLRVETAIVMMENDRRDLADVLRWTSSIGEDLRSLKALVGRVTSWRDGIAGAGQVEDMKNNVGIRIDALSRNTEYVGAGVDVLRKDLDAAHRDIIRALGEHTAPKKKHRRRGPNAHRTGR